MGIFTAVQNSLVSNFKIHMVMKLSIDLSSYFTICVLGLTISLLAAVVFATSTGKINRRIFAVWYALFAVKSAILHSTTQNNKQYFPNFFKVGKSMFDT